MLVLPLQLQKIRKFLFSSTGRIQHTGQIEGKGRKQKNEEEEKEGGNLQQ